MVNVLIHTDTRYPVNRKLIRKMITETIEGNMMANNNFEISVAVVGQRKMRQLAQRYLGEGSDHAVLAFPFEDVSSGAGVEYVGFVNPPDEKLRLGEVVLCWPKILDAAASDNVMVDEELTDLVSLSVEHLLGKHHD